MYYEKSLIKLQTTVPAIATKSMEEFNEWVDKYKPLAEQEIVLTKSNNISQESLWHMPCCGLWKRNNVMEFHYISFDFEANKIAHLRVIYSMATAAEGKEEEKKEEWVSLAARAYFKELFDVIPDDDHEEDTELFTCEENCKSTYYNYVDDCLIGITLHDCYSLDRNNSFMASLKEVYPQTAKWVDAYYAERLRRKGTPGYENFKLYGSMFVGWLKRSHRYHAWKKIVSNSNRKVHELRKYIESQGHTVVLVNTDAVKFIGKIDYEETTELGGFKYEWEACDMYIKGVKSYAYKKKGEDKWHFKQAGSCKLDKVKPRDEWTLEEWRDGNTQVEHIEIDKKNYRLVRVYR